MTAVYGSQSTPRVLMVVSTLKAKHQTLFFLQWLLQRSTKKENHSNNTNSYTQTKKTVNTENISGMFIVF